MKNLLLVFLNDLEDLDGLNEMLDVFDKDKHILGVINDIKNDKDFDIALLSGWIELYKNEYENIDKIIVMSNSRDLLFCWYRIYNSLVDDFVYFIDKDDKNYFESGERHYEFYKRLSEFNNIENESIAGKIYLNISMDNYEEEFLFLKKNNNYRYFDSIKNYNDDNTKEKDLIARKYICKKNEYVFGDNSHSRDAILLNENIDSELNKNIVEDLHDNTYFIKYVLIELSKQRSNNQINNELVNLVDYAGSNLDINEREDIIDCVIQYLENNNNSFEEKIYLYSLCVKLKSDKSKLSECMMITLIEDHDNLNYHYAVLFNSLFYCTSEGMKISDEIYRNRREEMIKLGQFFKKQGKIKVDKTKRRNNEEDMKIAIHYDQLLSINHSPTKLALDLAKNIKKYYPNCEVKIFVEDNLIINSNEVIVPISYSSAASFTCSEIHKEYLEGWNVDIYYSNPKETKIQRTKEIVEEINKFDPDVIYTTSDLSIAREILYPYYPIVYRSHGGYNFSTLADKYLFYGEGKTNFINVNKRISLIEGTDIISMRSGVEFLKPCKIISKSDYDICQESFILVTVGNRLDVEMTKEFIDMMKYFVEGKRDVVWIIIGPKKIDYLNKSCQKLIKNKQIITIEYENDLATLYKICDIYINPVRKGGGLSIGMAMNEGMPVIVTNDSQDGSGWIGIENCVGVGVGPYTIELNKLYNNKLYLKEKQDLMKQEVYKFRYETYLKDLMEVFYLVQKNRCNN